MIQQEQEEHRAACQLLSESILDDIRKLFFVLSNITNNQDFETLDNQLTNDGKKSNLRSLFITIWKFIQHTLPSTIYTELTLIVPNLVLEKFEPNNNSNNSIINTNTVNNNSGSQEITTTNNNSSSIHNLPETNILPITNLVPLSISEVVQHDSIIEEEKKIDTNVPLPLLSVENILPDVPKKINTHESDSLIIMDNTLNPSISSSISNASIIENTQSVSSVPLDTSVEVLSNSNRTTNNQSAGNGGGGFFGSFFRVILGDNEEEHDHETT